MKIYFLSQADAERLTPNNHTAMISIISPHGQRNMRKWIFQLLMQFDDVTAPAKGVTAFTKADANRLKSFIKGLPQSVDTIIVHCEAGISRSAAVAKWLNELYKTNDFPIMYMAYNKYIYNILGGV
jgi:predicted protein tyrosine phosphatase